MSETQLPLELIEKFRQTGIRLDRSGRFWHQDGEVTHKRFRQTLLRWLDTLDDGRTILRLDAERYAYIDVDDAHLLITSLRQHEEGFIISLNDETEETLDCETLWQTPDNTLYCLVKERKLKARFQTQPYYKLAEFIEAADEGFALRIGEALHPIATRPA